MSAKRKRQSKKVTSRKRRIPNAPAGKAKLIFSSPAQVLAYVVRNGLAVAVEKSEKPSSKDAVGQSILFVTGRESISIRAGVLGFKKDTAVGLPKLEVGCDYGIILKGKKPFAEKLTAVPTKKHIAGFHFAPGGNATGNSGGDSTPAINPLSCWDEKHRPSCADPRGMTFVESGNLKFWADIYLLNADHLTNGTSKFGVPIADGNDTPANPAGGKFAKLDYATADAVMKYHGKGLIAEQEFYAAAGGVTEKSSAKGDPLITGLDAARTSKSGLMQATGNLWIWGNPRPSFFGGSWWGGGGAGSRCADVAFSWPGNSDGNIGARGRSDHLNPV